MEKFFKVKEHGSTVKTEVLAGITTFMAMAYILMVNANMFSELGVVSYNAIYIATAISAVVGTFLIAFLANLPLGLASGMGLNAFFVYTVCFTFGLSYANALILVLLDGVVFIILTLTGVRKMLFDAIPQCVRMAISAGIGLFIAFLGLQDAGIIVPSSSTCVNLTSFNLFNGNATWAEIMPKLVTIAALIILYWALQNLQLIFSVMSKILTLFMPFLIGGVIAFIMNVPMKQIERHLFQKEQYQTEKFAALRRTCAYVLTLLAIIVILAAAMVIVIPQLVSTIADIVKLIPGQFQNVQQFLMEQAKAYPQIEQQLASVQIDWESLLKSAMDFVTAGTKGIISGGIGAVTSIVSGVTNFFIGFIFSIYVLFQKETLARQTKKILYAFTKEKTAQKVLRVVRLANTTFASFLSGQCLEACILGTMFCVTMLVIRLPYALLIGIVIAITALIPIVGAFIGCVVGIILIGLVNPVKAVIFVIMFFVLQQIEGNLIYPHVVGSSVGLPGMWVLMAVTVGGSLFGIVGMLTFIPICSVCYALFRLFVNERLKEKREI